MEQFHHSRLYGKQQVITAAESQGLLRAIMAAFEVLHRHRWSAPWEIELGAIEREAIERDRARRLHGRTR